MAKNWIGIYIPQRKKLSFIYLNYFNSGFKFIFYFLVIFQVIFLPTNMFSAIDIVDNISICGASIRVPQIENVIDFISIKSLISYLIYYLYKYSHLSQFLFDFKKKHVVFRHSLNIFF